MSSVKHKNCFKKKHNFWKLSSRVRPSRVGFKQGNQEYKRRSKSVDSDKESVELPSAWMPRCSKDDFDMVTKRTPDGQVIFGPTPERTVGTARYLRPRISEMGNDSNDSTVDVDYNIIASKQSILDMMNEAYAKHAGQCDRPNFTVCDTIKKGVTERWKLECRNCGFQSDFFKLYQEAEKTGRGAKKAEPNIGIAFGAQEIGYQSKCRMMLACSNTNTMSRTSLQRDVNLIGEKTVQLNELDMHNRRTELSKVRSLRNLDKSAGLNIEMDGLYNSRTYGRRGRAGQSATQMVELAIENETPKKQVIGISILNKICYKGAWLLGRGFEPKCGMPDSHIGCKANVPDHKALREYDAGKNIGMKFALEHLHIHTATTDGDSSAVDGLVDGLSAISDNLVTTERLADKYHLGQCQFRAGLKAQFTDEMFVGDQCRKDATKCLSSDIAIRSDKIFDYLFQKYNGNVEVMSGLLAEIVDRTVDCYNGECKACDSTNQCGEGASNWWVKSRTLTDFGLSAKDLKLSPSDKLLIRALLEMRLSKISLKKLRFNSSTQKCESVNRRLNSSASKSVTHLRNFEPQIQSQVHTINNSRQISIPAKRKLYGLKTGSPSIDVLKRMDKDTNYSKEYKQRPDVRTRKSTRRSIRTKKFYAAKKETTQTQTDYKKGKLEEPDISKVKRDHSYSQRDRSIDDHPYSILGTSRNPKKSQPLVSER